MEEDRGRSAERLITFTDAVVAIAITLLALPLIEVGTTAAHESLGTLLRDELGQLVVFAISFLVIARLWWGHHRVFAHVVRWSRALVVLTVLWLFTIVLLPPVTALTPAYDPQQNTGIVALYIGLMTVSSALLSAMAVLVRRRPDLTEGHDDHAFARTVESVETTIGFLIALLVGTSVPRINYLALLVLLISGQVSNLIIRRHERRPARSG